MIPAFHPAARPIKAMLDLRALAHNLAVARALASPARTYAVVKANAYGHGVSRVLPGLAAADGLALLELETAIYLRALAWRKPILLLEGFFDARELPVMAEHGFATVVHHESQVHALCAARLERRLDVFVKVNTGMNRLGLPPADIAQVVSRLRGCGAVRTLTLMTHFASADEPGGLREPTALFRTVAAQFDLPVSLANSAGVIRYREVGGDVVRPGIMLYGSSPLATQAGSAASLGLRPVMSLCSRIIAVQSLEPGDRVGYGGAHRAERPERIGIVACGYADGYPRHAPDGTPVEVAGVRTRLIGRVSMDMLAVDLSGLPEAQVGAPVELWGSALPVDDVAASAGTIGYELLCGVTQRVPFEVTGLTP
ncbi:MAG: alanine racemase [Burkholderiales bacterium]|nr:alanine racemase [Burkholderiales bacterium]